MKRMIQSDKRGFTLVEVLVVMVIVAILAAAAVPTMAGFIDDAKIKSYTAEARSVYVTAQAVATELSVTKKGLTGDDEIFLGRIKELLGEDVAESSYKNGITLDAEGIKVTEVKYTAKNGHTITIIGENVIYD